MKNNSVTIQTPSSLKIIPLHSTPDKQVNSDFIVLKTHKEGLFFVPYSNIVRIEAAKSYSLFYFIDGSSFLCSHNLNYYMRRISERLFKQVHKSHIVNVTYVKELDAFEKVKKIILSDKTIITLSRRKAPPFIKQLNFIKFFNS